MARLGASSERAEFSAPRRRRDARAAVRAGGLGGLSSAASGWREATPTSPRRSTSASSTPPRRSRCKREHGVDVPGEENRFDYLPRGVAGVIAPWNFPLAILTGMTAAALATGNTVVMKPAEQSSVIAAAADGDLPRGRLARRACSTILPGRGEVAGAALVEHPDVAADRLHRLAAGRAWRSMPRRPRSRKHGSRQREARHRRDGRQERDHRRRRRRPRRSRARRGEERLRLSGAEVLGVLPGDRAGRRLRRRSSSRLVEATQEPEDRPGRGPRHERRPGDRRRVARRIQQLHRDRQERRAAGAWRSMPAPLAEQGYFVGPHIFADVPPDRPHRPGRDLRPGAGRDPRRRSDRGPAHRQRHRLRPDRRHLHPQPGQLWTGPAASSWSATCTSTARSPAPSSTASRSAASRCRASAARPAAATTCCSSSCRGRSPSIRCGEGLHRRSSRESEANTARQRDGETARQSESHGLPPSISPSLLLSVLPREAARQL